MPTEDLRSPANHICDAQDRMGDAADLAELVRMAFMNSNDLEGRAICTALLFAQDALTEAKGMLDVAKEKINPQRTEGTPA